MYIQITTRCNMKCEHCCFSCTSIGNDMDIETFKKAISIASSFGDMVAIGGGEPTLHSDLWEMICIAISSNIDNLWLSTNGKLTAKSLILSGLAKNGIVGVSLSIDRFHENIDQSVIESFNTGVNINKGRKFFNREKSDWRSVLDYSYDVISIGRAAQNKLSDKEGCPCDNVFVDCDGSIWACGCKTVSFGTVDNPKIPTGCMKKMNHANLSIISKEV